MCVGERSRMTMKSKRIWALVIAVSLLAGMFPAHALAAGPDEVVYERLKPEVSILNRYTGANTKVYESLMSDGSFFNAIDLFTIKTVAEYGGLLGDQKARYSDVIAGKTLVFEDFDKSVINTLSLTRGNLQANVSATFHNHLHSHKTGTYTSKYILGFSGLDFWVTGDCVQSLKGKSKRNETNPRLGNMDFHTLLSDKNGSMELKYTNSFVFYDDKVCTCKGHYVTKTVVAFKDERAPRLKSVVFKKNDDDTPVNKGYFGSGDTIKIEVAYDEPIRFADDEKKHGDLYIRLQVEGVTPDKYPQARLTKLDTDTLHFEYKIPDETGIFQEINGVDLSPLMGENLPLVQLYGGGAYTINPPEGVDAIGFSKTTSYITDLAGNAITEKTAIRKAYIDTTGLKIDKIAISLVANNQDVKEVLGKTNPEGKDYLDASDNHLGVGDRVTVSLVMNKKINMNSTYPGSISYRKLRAYTNWKDGNGAPVVVESRWANPVLAASGAEVTGIELEPIIIEPDMHCADGENASLKITNVEFDGNIPFEDLAGNKYTQLNLSGLDISMPDCFIDTKLPDITTTAHSSGEGDDKVYSVIPITENVRRGTFRFPFKLTDASGVGELKGGFSWHVEDAGVPFEYVVKATASLDGEEIWQAGSSGLFYKFIQTGTEQNVFIRPLENQEYGFSDTELLFYAKDYAGNHHLQKGETPVSFKIDASWDNVAPTAKAGSVTRNPKVGGGWNLTVDILLEDRVALDGASVKYKWLDENPGIPLTVESIGGDDWAPVGLIFDAGTLRSGIAKATETVDSGTRFSKHLVVRATDTSGNESVTYLGKYEYDLSAIDYVLSYPLAVVGKASLKIERLQEKIDGKQGEGALLFMIPVPVDDENYDSDRPDEHFVCLYKATEPEMPISPEPGIRDVFNRNQEGFTATWMRMRVTKTGEAYNFKAETWETTEAEGLEPEHRFNLTEFVENLAKSTNTFCGEIPVTVLAGPEDAFEIEELYVYVTPYGLRPTTASGVSVEEVVLRVSSPNAPLGKTFADMSITTSSSINTEYAPGFWEEADRGTPMLSSAEGVEFSVNLGKDVNGWSHEDIDYANSYVELKHQTSSESFKVYLASSPEQTVVFPKDDYKTGFYSVKLVVACKAGRGYTITLNEQMYIDCTPPVQDFGISSLTYAEKNYKDDAPWHTVDGSINHYANTEKIYLPVHASTATDIENILKVKIEEVTEMPLPSTYASVAWNATAGMTAKDAAYSITRETAYERSFMMTIHDSLGEAKDATGTTSGDGKHTLVGLVKNRPNTIAVQVQSANGKESAIRYYVIHPVDEGVKGSLSVTQGADGSNVVPDGNLIFTPAQGQIMEGTKMYVSVGYNQSGKLEKKSDLQGQEMTAQADGTYTYPLLAGREGSERYVYSVYAIDSYGNLTLFGEIDTAVVDQEGPRISAISSSTSDGLYEAKFRIEDDTLYAAKLQGENGWSRLYQPMDISLRFDKDHAEWLGIHENTRLDLTLNESEEAFFWEATGSSETGIYEVTAKRKKADGADAWDTPHWLEVTVKGIVGYREGKDPGDFNLIMDARDALGNSTAGTPGAAKFTDPANIKPVAITSGADAPAYVNTGTGQDKALKLTFNFQVLPEASWICPEPKYGKVQTDAFPITDDGSWTISYSDIFGKTYEQELTLTDVFKEYGMALSISPLELTTDPVALLVRNAEKDPNGTFTVTDLSENPEQEKKIKVTKNQSLMIVHEPYRDQLKVHINNIIKGTPEADPHFYFEAIGTEYTRDTLPPNTETNGNVLVWYETSRNVSPTGDTGSNHIFKYGENTSHTFTYKDDFDYIGSLTVDLAAWGITLTNPLTPMMGQNPEVANISDTTAPLVTVALNAKRFGTYRMEESFGDYTKVAGIKDAFEAVHYVQGYLMALDVYDQSSYKVVVKKNTPDSIVYAEAASDAISGVSVAGNAIIINKAKGVALEDFTIVVVDNAVAESGAAKDNFTCIELKAADMAAWFDNTAPEAEVQGKWLTLYSKNLFVRLTDKADNDASTPLVTLDSPKLDKETDAASPYRGWYKRTFKANGSDYLVFYDMAGNMGTKLIEVTSIDETVPELSTTWSPHYIHPTTPSENDPGSPPEGPLNTNVTATISCNTNIESVTAEYSGDRGSTWVDGSAPEDQALKDKVSYKYSANQIFVTFAGDGCGIRLTVTAPNGKTATETLFLNEGVIDKGQPIINSEVDYQYRAKSDGGSYSVPYAAKITIKPNKPSYCTNAGQWETLYSGSKPFVISVYTNETQNFTFTDKAGNHKDVEVKIDIPIDNTPPKLTVGPANTIGLKMTSGSAEVKIKSNEAGTAECDGAATPLVDLTANTEQAIAFSENGVYVIKVYDLAGNSNSVSVVVGNIDRAAPKLSFDEGTIRLLQDSSLNDLKALLDKGVTAWDSETPKASDLVVTYALTDDKGHDVVKLDKPGLYAVTYTAKDPAGNEGIAIRFVKVIDKDLPRIVIDRGMLAQKTMEPEETTVLPTGVHTLHVEGLVEIAPGIMEPYTLKIRRGIVTVGQMKYYASTVPVAADGGFTVSKEGFYTVYIVTQSRQSVRTLLYVER